MRVSIHFESRPDGGLRIWSDDCPGLVLSHPEPERVGADLVPALRILRPELFEPEALQHDGH